MIKTGIPYYRPVTTSGSISPALVVARDEITARLGLPLSLLQHPEGNQHVLS